ncbi:MAG TPA: S8 family serine peptidase [Bacteroidales bacterium]|nr:S8 family serine peptidase [Bacteroidales bacterium]
MVKRINSHMFARLIAAFLLIFPFVESSGQANYYIRVYFRDKGTNPSYDATQLLSERALARREKEGVPPMDFSDFPVNRQYINSIVSMGYRLHSTSKWMNTALFETGAPPLTENIRTLPYVADLKIVKTPGIKSKFINKLDFELFGTGQAPYDRPITMLNGYSLHKSGFVGKNILIAVLDGGFTSADKIESLKNLRLRNGIISTYDFVNNTKFVYNANTHGTAVMSILAGDMPGYIAGTAPAADYLLLKTEDVNSEFPCEEDFWAAGAEYADSAGADIISSSLGYYEFDDPSMNYKHSDLDGNTAFVTRAADIAASKGILVVNSAGNERDNTWQKIIFPSDGDSVLAIGAVDENKVISSFSSSGPAADGRIKPDVSAMGVLVPLQTAAGLVSRASGTSFSCPVISGMCACLLQAVPMAKNYDVITALHEGSDRFPNPDALYGYGIPDMAVVLGKLQDKYVKIPEEDILLTPNPFRQSFEIIFKNAPGTSTIEIYSVAGKLIHKKTYPASSGRTLRIDALQTSAQGMYIIKVHTDAATYTGRIIKIRE